MLIRNMPIRNAQPRGPQEARNYTEARTLKAAATYFADYAQELDQGNRDLENTEDEVVLRQADLHTKSFGRSQVSGFASFSDNPQTGEKKTDFMHMSVDPDKFGEGERTFTIRQDGDKVRYTRQFDGSEKVEHVVHDTAMDTISYFYRDEKGRFIEND